jgi:hypothetical protein
MSCQAYILQLQYVDLDLRTFLWPLEPIVKDDLHTTTGSVEGTEQKL